MNLHEALKIVKEQVETGTARPYRAICVALEKLELDTFVPVADQLQPLFERWPKYSGMGGYPVPSPVSKFGAAEMYYYALEESLMWTGEYGDLRRELLDFLLEETKP